MCKDFEVGVRLFGMVKKKKRCSVVGDVGF